MADRFTILPLRDVKHRDPMREVCPRKATAGGDPWALRRRECVWVSRPSPESRLSRTIDDAAQLSGLQEGEEGLHSTDDPLFLSRGEVAPQFEQLRERLRELDPQGKYGFGAASSADMLYAQLRHFSARFVRPDIGEHFERRLEEAASWRQKNPDAIVLLPFAREEGRRLACEWALLDGEQVASEGLVRLLVDSRFHLPPRDRDDLVALAKEINPDIYSMLLAAWREQPTDPTRFEILLRYLWYQGTPTQISELEAEQPQCKAEWLIRLVRPLIRHGNPDLRQAASHTYARLLLRLSEPEEIVRSLEFFTTYRGVDDWSFFDKGRNETLLRVAQLDERTAGKVIAILRGTLGARSPRVEDYVDVVSLRSEKTCREELALLRSLVLEGEAFVSQHALDAYRPLVVPHRQVRGVERSSPVTSAMHVEERREVRGALAVSRGERRRRAVLLNVHFHHQWVTDTHDDIMTRLAWFRVLLTDPDPAVRVMAAGELPDIIEAEVSDAHFFQSSSNRYPLFYPGFPKDHQSREIGRTAEVLRERFADETSDVAEAAVRAYAAIMDFVKPEERERGVAALRALRQRGYPFADLWAWVQGVCIRHEHDYPRRNVACDVSRTLSAEAHGSSR